MTWTIISDKQNSKLKRYIKSKNSLETSMWILDVHTHGRNYI